MYKQKFRELSFSTQNKNESEWQKFLGPQSALRWKKGFSRDSYGFCAPLYPPSTFPCVAPNAEINTQIGRCFRISFHRALDEVRFSTLPIPLMKRLVSDGGPMDSISSKFTKTYIFLWTTSKSNKLRVFLLFTSFLKNPQDPGKF